MKIGIAGFENSGKKTIFELLTGRAVDSAKYRSEKQAISGTAQVLDARFDKVVQVYKPEKQVKALIEFQLLQPFEKSTSTDKEIIQSLKNIDALCLVVRQFKDDAVFHIDGSLDPARDIEWFLNETLLNDLVLVETRIKNIEEEIKKKPSLKKDSVGAIHELPLLLKMKEHLEKGLPLRGMEYDEEEGKILSAYQFLTDKCLIVILNVSEQDLKNQAILNEISGKFKNQNLFFVMLCAKIEKELLLLSKDENVGETYMQPLLEEYGITRPAIEALTQISYKSLGLISFFTASEKEVRSWTAKAGSKAPQAARSIHKDMEKGFIRAEVMKVDELVSAGSEKKLKEVGKLYVKGADYTVEDGDIFHVLFNV